MLCKSCVLWRKKTSQIIFPLGKGQNARADPILAEKKQFQRSCMKLMPSVVTVWNSFRPSQSLYPHSLCSCFSCVLFSTFFYSRNWLKTWICISGPFCEPEAVTGCLCLFNWIAKRWDGLCHLVMMLLWSCMWPKGKLCTKASKPWLQEKCSESFEYINYSITAHYSFSECVSLYLVFLCLARPEER